MNISLVSKSSALFAMLLIAGLSVAQTPAPAAVPDESAKADSAPPAQSYPPELVQQGRTLFRQYCSFCHGRNATGGESGPDLTRSKLLAADKNGDQIGPVVRNGRPDKGMPRFDLSDDQIAS